MTQPVPEPMHTLFIGGCVAFIAVMVAVIALVVHYATVIDKVRW